MVNMNVIALEMLKCYALRCKTEKTENCHSIKQQKELCREEEGGQVWPHHHHAAIHARLGTELSNI
jgi:hypothetical protein